MWHPFSQQVTDADGRAQNILRWDRILVAVFCSLIIGWLLVSSAAWTYLRYRQDIRTVALLWVVNPSKWQEVRRAIGDNYLRQADTAMVKKEFEKALHLYRSGLARSPRNTNGRISLAQLYLAYRRPELARAVFADNIAQFADQRTYLQTALEFLLRFQFDADLATACQQLLAADLSPPERELVALFAATVSFHRGNYDRMEELLRQENLTSSPQGALLLARADFERGYADLALLRLQDLSQREDVADETFVLTGQIRRQLGQMRELELNATQRLANNPLSHSPRIDFLFLHHQRKDEAALAREVSNYLSLFRRDQTALLALADFAANTARPSLASQIQKLFAENGWPTDATNLLTAEAYISAEKFAEGLDALQGAARLDPEGAKRLSTVYDSLYAVALFGLNRSDEARLHLEHLLAQPNLRAENLQAVASRLTTLGQRSHARAVLARAAEIDPLNQVALSELVRLDALGRHFDTLPSRVRRLLEMRKPSREVLNLASQALGSDLNLFHPEQTSLLSELRTRTGRIAASESL